MNCNVDEKQRKINKSSYKNHLPCKSEILRGTYLISIAGSYEDQYQFRIVDSICHHHWDVTMHTVRIKPGFVASLFQSIIDPSNTVVVLKMWCFSPVVSEKEICSHGKAITPLSLFFSKTV